MKKKMSTLLGFTKYNMGKKKIFIFDMDGVIINSVDSLLGLYGDFLSKFDVNYDLEDLKKVNGMNIQETAKLMKEKYDLKHDESFLAKEYDIEMKKRYEKVLLVEGIKEILDFLNKEHMICLASSSKRDNIDYILNKFELRKYFSLIVSGDDVSKAKPSPEIYQKIINKFSNQEHYVIEDSFNGLKAAKLAGAKTIYYNPEKKEINDYADFDVNHLSEIKNLILEIETEIKIIAPINDIDFILKDYNIPIGEKDKVSINESWRKQLEKNPNAFNGKIICYLSHKIFNGKVTIDYFISEYKLFLARFLKKVNVNIYPIAVNGLSYHRNKFIIAKRKGTTEYNGYWEFVPSGGINPQNILANFPPKSQINEELLEELGIQEDMKNIKPFYLFFDKKHDLYSIGCLIKLSQEIDINKIVSGEYSEFKILENNDVEEFMKNSKFVPISKVLFKLLNEAKIN